MLLFTAVGFIPTPVCRVLAFCHSLIFIANPRFLVAEGENDSDGGSGSSAKDSKELFILRKTLAELELRIETQKRTLAARDESVRRLLEMLQVRRVKGCCY